MSNSYDVIVLGVGAMGSAALYHLAKRGRRCLGLEQFNVPHDRGSSHGVTRIIRLPYYEHSSYVPLVRRAYRLWQELESVTGTRLLHVTGSVDAGPPESSLFEGAKRSCALYDLPHEILTSAELTKRFPGYRLPADSLAVFQPEGGFLLPETCVSSHAMLAQAHGAELHAREKVLSWEPSREGVKVVTKNSHYLARRLVISAGAWISRFVPLLKDQAVPERQVLGWFQPRRPEWFQPDTFPVFNLAVDEGRYYGLPVFGIPGFKFARYHHREERVDPDTYDRECGDKDEELLRGFGERYFPDGCGSVMSMQTCMFTNTPDEHFVIDVLPGCEQVIVASPCSGHGFKFSSVIGEILADLVEDGSTSHDISLLRIGRLCEKERLL